MLPVGAWGFWQRRPLLALAAARGSGKGAEQVRGVCGAPRALPRPCRARPPAGAAAAPAQGLPPLPLLCPPARGTVRSSRRGPGLLSDLGWLLRGRSAGRAHGFGPGLSVHSRGNRRGSFQVSRQVTGWSPREMTPYPSSAWSLPLARWVPSGDRSRSALALEAPVAEPVRDPHPYHQPALSELWKQAESSPALDHQPPPVRSSPRVIVLRDTSGHISSHPQRSSTHPAPGCLVPTIWPARGHSPAPGPGAQPGALPAVLAMGRVCVHPHPHGRLRKGHGSAAVPLGGGLLSCAAMCKVARGLCPWLSGLQGAPTGWWAPAGGRSTCTCPRRHVPTVTRMPSPLEAGAPQPVAWLAPQSPLQPPAVSNQAQLQAQADSCCPRRAGVCGGPAPARAHPAVPGRAPAPRPGVPQTPRGSSWGLQGCRGASYHSGPPSTPAAPSVTR